MRNYSRRLENYVHDGLYKLEVSEDNMAYRGRPARIQLASLEPASESLYFGLRHALGDRRVKNEK